MRFVFGLVLILGLGLAGSAVYLVQGYINQNSAELEQARVALSQQVSVTPIYVAAVPLKYGQRLTPEDVRLINFPSSSLPEGVFQDEAALFPDANAAPRRVLRAMEANEPILAVKVSAPGQDAGVSTMLSPGMRAFAINVDAQSGVSGFLRPGDRVDISWNGTINGVVKTLPVDTNIRIIAVDQSADQDNLEARVARTITVEGTAQQVANFTQAQATGRLYLSLVGVGDTTQSEASEVDTQSLFGIQPEVAPQEEVVQEERKCFITVRQGIEDVQKEIRCPEQP